MSRLNKYIMFSVPNKDKCLRQSLMLYNEIKIDNNFIIAFKEYQQLKNKGFKLIMFDNCIFYVSLCPEIFNTFKLVS